MERYFDQIIPSIAYVDGDRIEIDTVLEEFIDMIVKEYRRGKGKGVDKNTTTNQ